MRKRNHAGFTTTETIAVLTISIVLGLVAFPKLGKSRRAKAVSDYARSVSSMLNLTRLRAINSRRAYRVTFTPTTITREFTSDNGVTWTPELQQNAPGDAQLWSASTTQTAPSGPNSSISFNVRFNADFTIVVNGDPALTNAFFYVADRTSSEAQQGSRMQVAMVGTGTTRVYDAW